MTQYFPSVVVSAIALDVLTLTKRKKKKRGRNKVNFERLLLKDQFDLILLFCQLPPCSSLNDMAFERI